MSPRWHFLFSFLIAGCSTSAGGPSPPAVSVEVIDAAGQHTPRYCARLPVLIGSHTQDDIDVDGKFGLVLFSSNEALDLVLEGATFDGGPTVHSVAAADLLESYNANLALTSTSGEQFVLHVASGCPS
jgi:hypothetical protein